MYLSRFWCSLCFLSLYSKSSWSTLYFKNGVSSLFLTSPRSTPLTPNCSFSCLPFALPFNISSLMYIYFCWLYCPGPGIICIKTEIPRLYARRTAVIWAKCLMLTLWRELNGQWYLNWCYIVLALAQTSNSALIILASCLLILQEVVKNSQTDIYEVDFWDQ